MRIPTIALIALVALAAGCAKKKVADLPPPPMTTPADAAATATPADGAVGSAAVPAGAAAGSREAFVAEAGSDKVRFAYDSYELDADARAILDRQAGWLGKNGAVRITVEGHADERGTREYNLALGERRAIAIRSYLATRGVDAGRIATISYGKERPEVEGSDDASYAENRRGVTVLGASAG